MAVTYGTLKTEDLGDDQKRYLRAYEISGAGVVFNIRVTLTIKAPYQADAHQDIVDEEIFIPNITYSDLSGMQFSTLDTLDLGNGQKRVIRKYTLPSSAAIISVVGTAEFKQGKVTKTIVRSEELYYQPSASESQIFQHKTPYGEWISSTEVDFASRPGHPSTNQLLLADGYPRSFSGTLHWKNINDVGDLGWDSALSRDSGSAWIYWYMVPATGNNSALTVVASDNPPATGPDGRSMAKVCWAAYRSGSSILKVQQVGNRFDHTYRDVYADYNISDESSYSSISLANFVPETAAIARLFQRAIMYGTQASQDRWYVRICSSAADSALLNFIDIRAPWDTQRSPQEVVQVPQHYISSHYIPSVPHTIPATDFPATTIVYRTAAPSYYMHAQTLHFEAPLFGSRTLYKKRDRVSGSQNDLYFDGLQSYGWVDKYIEP
jgi:hypothetical protein